MALLGTCPTCGRVGLRLRKPNDLIPRHKPDYQEFADKKGYCTDSGRWVADLAPRGAYAGWNNGSV